MNELINELYHSFSKADWLEARLLNFPGTHPGPHPGTHLGTHLGSSPGSNKCLAVLDPEQEPRWFPYIYSFRVSLVGVKSFSRKSKNSVLLMLELSEISTSTLSSMAVSSVRQYSSNPPIFPAIFLHHVVHCGNPKVPNIPDWVFGTDANLNFPRSLTRFNWSSGAGCWCLGAWCEESGPTHKKSM